MGPQRGADQPQMGKIVRDQTREDEDKRFSWEKVKGRRHEWAQGGGGVYMESDWIQL